MARPPVFLLIGAALFLSTLPPLFPLFATHCPRRAVSRNLDQVRALAIRSDSYSQNYFRPACGMGREAATAAWIELEAIARANPYPLLRLLKDPDREVRGPCALVPGWTKNDAPLVSEQLALMLGDPDAGIRCCAAAALGKIGDRNAAPALTAALRDQDPEVRRIAAGALDELRAQSTVDGAGAATGMAAGEGSGDRRVAAWGS